MDERTVTATQDAHHGVRAPGATAPRPVPEEADLDDPRLYFNRELSTLDFNRRVLWQARDERYPILERLFYLAITGSNMDEFFRKRVGGLKRQAAAGVRDLTVDGRSPQEQLQLIRKAVRETYADMETAWTEELAPCLRAEVGLQIRHYEELTPEQQVRLDEHFYANIFPILTPLAVDPGHPFPFLSNLSLSLAVLLRHPSRDTEHFARVKVPVNQGRWVPLEEENHFVPLEEIIAHNLDELFRGMEVVSVHPFRVTRNADIRRNEEEAEDLMEMISEELRERRFAPVVRLEIGEMMPDHVRDLLTEELALHRHDVYRTRGLLGHADLMPLARISSSTHRFEPWEPVVPPRLLREGDPTTLIRMGKTSDHPDIFSAIRERDLLVHHPYESFSASVQRFLEEAADDPNVLAIKQTLYRTSDDSPIVKALIRAAEKGKQVAVLVEVTARFDEESNIEWGQKLEKSGVHVTYGLVGLKTHTKVALVIRREKKGLRAYCHIGTGNYNATTARTYTDFGLFTCRPDIGYDVINLFHYLTGYAPEQHYRKMLIAPRNMRETFVQLVDREIEHHREHGDGRIMAKMNALHDLQMIGKLYEASREGVQVDLVVRGHCRMRPGLEGFSENVRIVSILGRFLEHSRIYWFHNNGDPDIFIGSADWMSRNLDDRVEAITPIEDPRHRERLEEVLRMAIEDRRLAWELKADGSYLQRMPRDEEEGLGFQERLMLQARARTERAMRSVWDA